MLVEAMCHKNVVEKLGRLMSLQNSTYSAKNFSNIKKLGTTPSHLDSISTSKITSTPYNISKTASILNAPSNPSVDSIPKTPSNSYICSTPLHIALETPQISEETAHDMSTGTPPLAPHVFDKNVLRVSYKICIICMSPANHVHVGLKLFII